MACNNLKFKGAISPKRKAWEDYPAPVLDEQTGCIRWQGPHSHKGYGRLGKKYAHREAWLRANRDIPPNMTIDHVRSRGCVHRDCVNINHMEVVTQGENARRGDRLKKQIEKTHCPKGHPYDGYNLIVRRGKRECRECCRIRNNAAYHRRKSSAQ